MCLRKSEKEISWRLPLLPVSLLCYTHRPFCWLKTKLMPSFSVSNGSDALFAARRRFLIKFVFNDRHTFRA